MRELIDQYNKILNETDKIALIDKLLSEDNGETLESGYSSIMNTFRGLRPNIKKIAILTAENPHGEKHSDEFNKKANFNLEKFLSSGKIPFKKIKGSYGSKENSFILFNIPKNTAIYIGDKYNQDSIIYGETGQTKDGDIIPMSFEMIGTDRSKPEEFTKVLGKTDVFVNRQNPEDFYSEIKGRKFVLPFYDVVDKFVGKDKKTYDLIKNYDKSKWVGGKVEPTSQEIKLAEEYLNGLSERSMNTVGSTSYNLRSRIRKLIGE
jgi:hypothetical protein